MRRFSDTDIQLGLFDDQIFPEPPRPEQATVFGITEAGWFWGGYLAVLAIFISIGIYYW